MAPSLAGACRRSWTAVGDKCLETCPALHAARLISQGLALFRKLSNSVYPLEGIRLRRHIRIVVSLLEGGDLYRSWLHDTSSGMDQWRASVQVHVSLKMTHFDTTARHSQYSK